MFFLIKEHVQCIRYVKAQFDGKEVRLGKDARVLYEQSGYGRPEKDGSGLRLAPVEALYLLHRNRIEIAGYDFDRLLSEFTVEPNFLRGYLVYRDLRERGYAVQTGPHDYRVFRRGGAARYWAVPVPCPRAFRARHGGFRHPCPRMLGFSPHEKTACPGGGGRRE